MIKLLLIMQQKILNCLQHLCAAHTVLLIYILHIHTQNMITHKKHTQHTNTNCTRKRTVDDAHPQNEQTKKKGKRKQQSNT